ncbi:helix-turn-helix transcriptional regulator [Terrihabitans rhizophilus]|uniref:Helix-turn-helix transcriptional regulator n=1 Tax=Terrihabitans rhizophilus TaxID=3092662 RepID=A0ABU4RT70_9HYPH|nr:helix-turn-helix transcriptional regulator [Terrihabitans sp. PJ23]MDX6807264.1 helix-turn-helix transcriptional regulator [Terrihabitans sp. PJ23]
MPDRVHHSIKALYEAALNPRLWPDALAKIAELFEARCAVIGPLARADRQSMVLSCGCPEAANSWLDTGSLQDGFCDLLAAKRYPIFDEEHLWVDEEFAPGKARHVIAPRIGIAVETLPNHTIGLLISRGPEGAQQAAADRRLLAILRGHLERAVALARARLQPEQAWDALPLILDSLAPAAALIDGRGRVVCANLHLRRPGTGLTTERGVLRTEHPENQQALEALLREVLERGADTSPRPVVVRREGRHPIMIHGLPILLDPEPDPLWPQAMRQRLVVLACDPELARGPSNALDLKLLGLTRTEARVASLIAEGSSPDEIAAICNSEASTVRVHLKRIYAKLQVSGQAQLAVLLARMGNPLGGARMQQHP